MSNAIKNRVQRDAQKTRLQRVTPQARRTPGRKDEVRNTAGGYVFNASDKDRLERFLILGTDGGTYYVSEQKLTDANIGFVRDLIRKDENLVRETLRNVAVNNRAPKNSPSLYVLALLLVEGKNKAATKTVVNDVARTGTHLFEFVSYVDSLGGWGRAKRDAVAEWYTGKTPEQLAYQAVKYRQREGWTHRDVFRKVHPTGVDPQVGNFILGKKVDTINDDNRLIWGFNEMQRAKSVADVVDTLNEFRGLPWETIPTQFLTDRKVWETLFYNGALGQTALLRNVTRFAKMGMLEDLYVGGDIAKALADSERIAKGRVHPVAYANALGIYRNGPVRDARMGYRGSRDGTDWNVNAKIAGALEAGFYAAFDTVEPANKATMISIDVSGSMTWGAPAGLVGMNYMEAAAVMAMVSVRTEPYAMVNAFAGNMQQLPISDSDSLDTVIKKMKGLSFGRTDCALPMVHAAAKRIGIDTFQIYTDNETWAGSIKPYQALVNYRKSMGRNSRLAVVALAATPFTIADPRDRGMMDFVGMDASAPRVMADFSAGRI
jgi:60 kDa SS-A/Ro ribonucleoprotein